MPPAPRCGGLIAIRLRPRSPRPRRPRGWWSACRHAPPTVPERGSDRRAFQDRARPRPCPRERKHQHLARGVDRARGHADPADGRVHRRPRTATTKPVGAAISGQPGYNEKMCASPPIPSNNRSIAGSPTGAGGRHPPHLRFVLPRGGLEVFALARHPVHARRRRRQQYVRMKHHITERIALLRMRLRICARPRIRLRLASCCPN